MLSLIYFLLIVSVSSKTFAESSSTFVQKDQQNKYKPTWESLDSRPLPTWYDEAKIGIFIHWGVFSVPSFGSEWFWSAWENKQQQYVDFMKKNYPPNFAYQDFARDFTAEFFNATKWANLFELSGAKYVVLTSKHHEGYTLWPSKYSFSWNSEDVGPKRDLIGELAVAIRENTDMRFGLYYSLFEWYNPLYLSDKASLYLQTNFPEGKVIPEMKELINKYTPDVLWSDGEWEATDEYWKAKEFLAWLYNESPVRDTVVANDRWGSGIMCHHGDFYTCPDRYNPDIHQNHKWENAMTLDTVSWGYRRNADISEYMSIEKLIRTLVETVSCGGNLNINIGPTKEGTIAPIYQERLLQMGIWLGYNGEAIYGTKPWAIQNDTIADAWYTSKDKTVYAIFLTWPEDNTLTLGSAKTLFNNRHCIVSLLGWQTADELRWRMKGNKVEINLPDLAKVDIDWGWVVKIKN